MEKTTKEIVNEWYRMQNDKTVPYDDIEIYNKKKWILKEE